MLTFTAVLREGIELALFLLAAQSSASSARIDLGAGLGLVTAVLLGWLLFSTTYRLDLRQFFRVTNLLLILFAAGLVAHGVHELNEVGWIPSVIEHVWDFNPVLSENSMGWIAYEIVIWIQREPVSYGSRGLFWVFYVTIFGYQDPCLLEIGE